MPPVSKETSFVQSKLVNHNFQAIPGVSGALPSAAEICDRTGNFFAGKKVEYERNEYETYVPPGANADFCDSGIEGTTNQFFFCF